ncbi:CBS domain-containing protein [Parasedimentitalea psychrophila]|uniref:CBS domain-containing protein n=1 Tax=Parasedimentitalea psychrophila TaxID=2997337 RepID=A0A9Y2L084_9RHOB|nr:CBS domain-containing protein [Parasedimentitalea psychrophila]WIY25674.1 CBS domain-containing protein [Parasedimentitalea psychrophila]
MYVSTILLQKGTDIYSVAPDDNLMTALQLFSTKKIGFALVLDKSGNPLGGISEREICSAMANSDGAGRQTPVREVMNTDVASCAPGDNLIRIMAMMTGKRNRHMLVCDDGGLRGVISIGDVVKHRLDEIMREEEELLKYIEGTGYSH